MVITGEIGLTGAHSRKYYNNRLMSLSDIFCIQLFLGP